MGNFLVGGFFWALGFMGAERVVRSGTASRVFRGVSQWCKDVKTVMDEDDTPPAKETRGEVIDFATGKTLQEGQSV